MVLGAVVVVLVVIIIGGMVELFVVAVVVAEVVVGRGYMSSIIMPAYTEREMTMEIPAAPVKAIPIHF